MTKQAKINKRDRILMGMTIAVIALSVFLQPSIMPIHHAPDDKPTLLVPKMKQHMQQLDALMIYQGGEQLVLTKSEGGIWQVEQAYGYPASNAKIRSLLLTLSQSELRDKKTADPERYHRIGLDSAQARRVVLQKEGTPLYEVYLGNIAADKIGTYVRFGDDLQSYRASGAITISVNPADWLDDQLVSIDRTRVSDVVYRFDEGQPYRFTREKAGERMQIDPPAKGKEGPLLLPLDPSVYFERMHFVEVMPATALKRSTRNSTTMISFDGLVITLRFHELRDGVWVEFAADVDASKRNGEKGTLKEPAQVQDEANRINERTAGWLYKIGQFQFNQLRRSYDDVISSRNQ